MARTYKSAEAIKISIASKWLTMTVDGVGHTNGSLLAEVAGDCSCNVRRAAQSENRGHSRGAVENENRDMP
jgi:hypothetical protein